MSCVRPLKGFRGVLDLGKNARLAWWIGITVLCTRLKLWKRQRNELLSPDLPRDGLRNPVPVDIPSLSAKKRISTGAASGKVE